MLNRSGRLVMSTRFLKALPGKLDIKRHLPTSSNLYVQSGNSFRVEIRVDPHQMALSEAS